MSQHRMHELIGVLVVLAGVVLMVIGCLGLLSLRLMNIDMTEMRLLVTYPWETLVYFLLTIFGAVIVSFGTQE